MYPYETVSGERNDFITYSEYVTYNDLNSESSNTGDVRNDTFVY